MNYTLCDSHFVLPTVDRSYIKILAYFDQKCI